MSQSVGECNTPRNREFSRAPIPNSFRHCSHYPVLSAISQGSSRQIPQSFGEFPNFRVVCSVLENRVNFLSQKLPSPSSPFVDLPWSPCLLIPGLILGQGEPPQTQVKTTPPSSILCCPVCSAAMFSVTTTAMQCKTLVMWTCPQSP